jgi:hypothetical protein
MWNAERRGAGRRWVNGIVLGLALVAAGCGDGTDVLAPDAARGAANGARVYHQTDFLGNPLVSEVTVVKALHDEYNTTQPYNTAQFAPQTGAFVTGVAGRPAALASLLASVLYPDILVVDSSKDPATAGWLSWALAGGWGGRRLTDDVVDVGLTAIFSTFLSDDPTASCAPFQLPLCTDNVGANDRPFAATFPYLAAPSL